MAKHVYIAVEVARREFDSRLLLAMEIAARGGSVLLARRADLQEAVPTLPPGVFIDTNLPVQSPDPRKRVGLLQKRVDRGILNVCMDEEGLVYPGCETYRAMRTSDETIALTDLFIAWGEASAKCFAEIPRERVLVAGNPRVDLLQEPASRLYTSEVQRIRDRYGHFVLFASNFAIANHAGGADFFKGQTQAYGWHDDKSVGSFLHDRQAFVRHEMKRFIAALRAASEEMPEDHQIVVRPHPADDEKTWLAITSGIKRCHVSKEGAIVPWLLAADSLVHSGCTTGLEAHLAGTPAFSLRDVSFPIETSLDLPDAVSHYFSKPSSPFTSEVRSTDAAAVPIKDYIEGSESARIIAEAVLDMAPETTETLPTSSLATLGRRRQFKLMVGSNALVHNVRNWMRRGSGYSGSLEARRYYLDKFESMKASDAHEKAQTLRAIVHRGENVNFSSAGPSMMTFFSNAQSHGKSARHNSLLSR